MREGGNYYILYVVTPSKGLQKIKIDLASRGFPGILAVPAASAFVKEWLWRFKEHRDSKDMVLSERIKLVCWNYGDDANRQPFIGLLHRALAFSKAKRV